MHGSITYFHAPSNGLLDVIVLHVVHSEAPFSCFMVSF
jgi:hypothetical protein